MRHLTHTTILRTKKQHSYVCVTKFATRKWAHRHWWAFKRCTNATNQYHSGFRWIHKEVSSQQVSSQEFSSSQHLNIGTLKVTRVGIQDYYIQTYKETKAALSYWNIAESVDFGSAQPSPMRIPPKLIKAKRESQIAEELAFNVADCGTEISYSAGPL